MNMTNPWQNPNSVAAVTGNVAPAQGAFAPAPAMTTAQSLAGIDSTEMSSRFPELPDMCKAQLKVVNFRSSKPGAANGLAYFIECEVLASPTHPQLVGTTATVKINGFTSPKGRTYALRDLKMVLTLLFAADGLTPSTQMSSDQWAQCADAAAAGRVIGRTFGAESRVLTGGVKPKVVHTFFAA